MKIDTKEKNITEDEFEFSDFRARDHLHSEDDACNIFEAADFFVADDEPSIRPMSHYTS